MQDFLTLEVLGSFLGATIATALVTEFLKQVFDRLQGRWVLLASYVCALAVIQLTAFFSGDFSPSGLFIGILNAVPVAWAANGGYDNASTIFPILVERFNEYWRKP